MALCGRLQNEKVLSCLKIEECFFFFFFKVSMNNLKVWAEENFRGLVDLDENAKQMGNELLNM